MLTGSDIRAAVSALRPGERIDVGTRDFCDAFPAHPIWGGEHGVQGAVDRFLSGVVGSAYGTVRVNADPFKQYVTITKHEEDDRASYDGFVYHVDEDRQYMFDRVPGGWKRKSGW